LNNYNTTLNRKPRRRKSYQILTLFCELTRSNFHLRKVVRKPCLCDNIDIRRL